MGITIDIERGLGNIENQILGSYNVIPTACSSCVEDDKKRGKWLGTRHLGRRFDYSTLVFVIEWPTRRRGDYVAPRICRAYLDCNWGGKRLALEDILCSFRSALPSSISLLACGLVFDAFIPVRWSGWPIQGLKIPSSIFLSKEVTLLGKSGFGPRISNLSWTTNVSTYYSE